MARNTPRLAGAAASQFEPLQFVANAPELARGGPARTNLNSVSCAGAATTARPPPPQRKEPAVSDKKPTETATGRLRRIIQNVNFRSAPDIAASLVRRLRPGQQMTVLDQGSPNPEWNKVVLVDKSLGFIKSSVLIARTKLAADIGAN